ncbi:MAG: hypothetical protein EOM66_11040, partial [Clostridia bacterium]|nr:hypothetical protein [Clostridia bacterium]
MKVAVLSGKGGTGKTFVSVNLAVAARNATYIDCDVEEPNGNLFLKPEKVTVTTVHTLLPDFDADKCNGCRKCVDFCHFNALAFNIREYEKRIKPGKSILTILPLFHGFGLGICIHTVLVSGVKAILVPQFSTSLFVDTIRKKRPNFIAGVPSMYQALIGSVQADNM